MHIVDGGIERIKKEVMFGVLKGAYAFNLRINTMHALAVLACTLQGVFYSSLRMMENRRNKLAAQSKTDITKAH